MANKLCSAHSIYIIAMPTFSLKLNKNIISIAILAVAIFTGGLFILHNVAQTHRDKIATGFLCDLLINFPLCYYFIIIRPLKKSPKSLLLVLTICCGIAYLVLPPHQRSLILQVRKLTVVAELAFFIYAFTKIKKIRSAYKIHQLNFADPLYNLRSSMADIFGDILPVRILASELAMLRYGILSWKKEKHLPKNAIAFSTHKESGYIAVWCILMVAVFVEVVAFHFLLMKWSHLAANIVTALTLYSVILFIADLSALVKRQVLVNDDTIILRTGLRWRAITTRDNIAAISKAVSNVDPDGTFMKGAALTSGINLLITFKEPVMLDKLYGARKEYKAILMSIDDTKGFIEALDLHSSVTRPTRAVVR